MDAVFGKLQDAVGVHGEGGPVADDQRHPAATDTPHGFALGVLGLVVESGGRFVKNHQKRISKQRAGDGDPLAFPAGEAEEDIRKQVERTHQEIEKLRSR